MKLEGVRAQGAGGKLLLNCFARYQLRGSNLVWLLKLTELDALEVPEKFMVVGVETNFWVSSKDLDSTSNLNLNNVFCIFNFTYCSRG